MKLTLVHYICPKCHQKVIEALPKGVVWCKDCGCWFTENGEILSETSKKKKKA